MLIHVIQCREKADVTRRVKLKQQHPETQAYIAIGSLVAVIRIPHLQKGPSHCITGSLTCAVHLTEEGDEQGGFQHNFALRNYY